MNPRVVAVIFARGGSKGVPRKNLRMLGGKPLVALSIETALATPAISRVVISTDDEEIAEVARQHGADVPFMRPAELASDTAPEWLAWQHAVNALADDGMDILVSLPPTSPLRAVEDVAACIDIIEKTDADFALCMTPATRNPYFNMVSEDAEGCVHTLLTAEGKLIRRQDAPPVFDLTTVAYAVRPQFVLDVSSPFTGKVRAVKVPAERAIDIDTELDLKIAGLLLAERIHP